MTAKIARFSWLPLALALAAGASAQPPAAPAPEPQADWKAAESPFLSGYAQLTLPERFIKAGEAYFDHQTPPRWIVFQATERPAKQGEEPSPHYAMYVAKLKYDGENIVGIDAPARLSQPGTANTCGWFHPTKPYTVLFGSTLTEPKKSDRPGFRVGTRSYVWQFPDEMEVCEINVSAIARELPKGDALGDDVRGMDALLKERIPPIVELRKAGKLDAFDKQFDALMAECDKKFPTARAIKNWTGGGPRPVFRRDRYDAECSYSPDGRFILYTHVREAAAPKDAATKDAAAAEAPAKDDGDIWIFDTQTLKQYPIVTADGYDGGPFFSPDGRRLCYRSDRKGDDKLQLFVADLKFEDGVPVGVKREHQLTMDENVNWAPFWHPSGKFLIYGSSAAGHSNYEVFAIPVPPLDSKDESDRARPARRITFAPGADILPAFSADGTWMMWTSQRGGVQPGEQRPTSQVWVARVKEAFSRQP
ncbi:MAG: hypothetical protein K2Q20_14075 [Phycisphaerales bacterium]|nr:hypothetical protein [Phycisphaerales bacterium]